MASMLRRLMGPGPSIALLRRSSVMNGCLRLLLRWLAVEVGNTIGVGRRALRLVVVSAKIVWMPIVAASWLRDVWNDLHATGDNAGRPSAASGVRGCSGASEALGQLLYECLADIVCSNVDCISDTKHD